MSGSVLAVATAALFGRPVAVPLELARVCYIIVGILLGTVVTPDTLRGVTTWPLSIALLIVGSLSMMAATSSYLRVVHRWDPLSALMGASPGSMAQVIALSSELGGDLRAIAIVQTVRVFCWSSGCRTDWRYSGWSSRPWRRCVDLLVCPCSAEMLLLAVVSTAFAVAFYRLRFPGGLLFGAMAGSGLLHGTASFMLRCHGGSAQARSSCWVDFVGSRFAGTTLPMSSDSSAPPLAHFAVAMTVATTVRADGAAFFRFRSPTLSIAFAPGAQDTMMVLALALHLDPVYVGAHHLARFLVVTFALAAGARRAARPKPAPRIGSDRTTVQREPET